MELKEFIKTALTDIVTAVKETQESVKNLQPLPLSQRLATRLHTLRLQMDMPIYLTLILMWQLLLKQQKVQPMA